MSDEINIKAKSKKIKLLIIIAAVGIALLTVGAVLFALSKNATAKKVEKQLSLGEKYLSALDYEQAIAAYELVIEIDPKNADAYIGLADVYVAMGEYEKAEELLDEAKDAVEREDIQRIGKKQEEVKTKKKEAEKSVMTPTPTPEPTTTTKPTATPEPTKETNVASGTLKALAETPVGGYVTFGIYEQDNDLENGAEPIEWLVLEKKDGKALVLSKKALDCKKYNEQHVDVTWETCTLREWLNNEFYRVAFSKEEGAAVAETVVKNPDNPIYGTEGGNDTKDKVFLLSIEEMTIYFDQDPNKSDPARVASVTEYAKAKGGFMYKEDEYGWYGTTEFDGNGWCCLRSPGYVSSNAASVHYNGVVDSNGGIVDFDPGVVRPAIWIDYTVEDGSISNTKPTVVPTPTPELMPTPIPTPELTPTPIPTLELTPTPIPTPTPTPEPTSIPKTENADYKYEIIGDEVTIIEYLGMDTKIVVPKELGGYPVTTIGWMSFRLKADVTEIELPDSIKRIEESAFNDCSSLQSIVLSKKLEKIGSSAFRGCTALTEVEVPSSTKIIDAYAFADCSSLTNVVLSEGVEEIGEMAFWNCNVLNRIEIPSSVKRIKFRAFDGCGLTEVKYSGELTEMGREIYGRYSFGNLSEYAYKFLDDGTIAFGGSAIGSLSSGDTYAIPSQFMGRTVTEIGDYAFGAYYVTRDIKFVIPSTVKKIGKNAFSSQNGISNIDLPDGLETIEQFAFMSCGNLTAVRIPDSVSYIGYGAFRFCDNLTTIYASKGSYAENWALNEGYKVVN